MFNEIQIKKKRKWNYLHKLCWRKAQEDLFLISRKNKEESRSGEGKD